MKAQNWTEWAVEPLNQQGAARAIGLSQRAFFDLLEELKAAKIDHCEMRRRRRVFYPEHIQIIREYLKWALLHKSPEGIHVVTPA